MQGEAIFVCKDGHRTEAEFGGGPHDTDSDFASVGDQQFLHAILLEAYFPVKVGRYCGWKRMICKMVESELFDAVYRAAGREEARRAVQQVYDDLQRAIDERRPICNASGRCCRFEEFDHRLYVTTLELAAFVYELELRGLPREKWDGTGCPFQISGLCSVHTIRPFGCRIFFCDATATHWQQDQYEQFHARLKQLHETLNVPYFYVEWRSALRMLSLTPGTAGDRDTGVPRS
jgi:Fe-S-cluster containining protein